MRNNLLLVFLALCITLPSTQVEARKGLGSLFKLGRGAKAINEWRNQSLFYLHLIREKYEMIQ